MMRFRSSHLSIPRLQAPPFTRSAGGGSSIERVNHPMLASVAWFYDTDSCLLVGVTPARLTPDGAASMMKRASQATGGAGLPTKEVKELGIWELLSDEDDGNPLGGRVNVRRALPPRSSSTPPCYALRSFVWGVLRRAAVGPGSPTSRHLSRRVSSAPRSPLAPPRISRASSSSSFASLPPLSRRRAARRGRPRAPQPGRARAAALPLARQAPLGDRFPERLGVEARGRRLRGLARVVRRRARPSRRA